MYRIPTDGKFKQPNRGEIFGNVLSSLNVDFKTNPGRLRSSARLELNTKDNDSGISGLGVPVGFSAHQTSSTKYYAACGIGDTSGTGKIMVSSDEDIDSAFVNDTILNTPTNISLNRSDMVDWTTGDYLTGNGTGISVLVSTISSSTFNIARLLGTSPGWDIDWFLTTVGGVIENPKMLNMCPGFNGNLYLTNGFGVTYVPPSSDALSSPQQAVNSGDGTLDFNGRYIPIWIRSSSNYLWIGLMSNSLDSGIRGYVAQWDATGTTPQKIIDINAPCALSCTILGDVPHIVDAYGVLKKFNGTDFIEVARLPVANLNIEMPNIYNPFTNARWIHHRGMDVVDGKININVNNLISTGNYVDSMPSGVWEYDPDIGLTHKNSPCASSTDFGQQMLSTAGAIFGSKREEGTYLAGYGYYTNNATTERKGIFHDDISVNTNKISSFITPFLSSDEITDSWQRAIYRHSTLPDGDVIVGKKRTKKDTIYPILIDITWSGVNSFLTSVDLTTKIGWEVEIVMGIGASKTAHITEVIFQDGSYNVEVDETFTGATGTAKVRVNNFEKMSSLIDPNSTEGGMLIDGTDTQVQIKTEVRATGDLELNDLTVISGTSKSAK